MASGQAVDPEPRRDWPSGGSAGISQDEIFDQLRNPRRRYVLHYLKRHDRPVELGDLASQIGAWEYDTTVEDLTAAQRKRVYTTLQQSHLEKMAEAGIVSYDAEEKIVEPTELTDSMAVYLEVVPHNEFAWREYYLALGASACALVVAAWIDVVPVSMVPDVAWAGVIAVALTLSAGYQVVRERDSRLGATEEPVELGHRRE